MFKNFNNHEDMLIVLALFSFIAIVIIMHGIYEVLKNKCKISELGFVWIVLPFIIFCIVMTFKSVEPERLKDERKAAARYNKETRYYITIGDDWSGYYCSSYQEHENIIEFVEYGTGKTITATKPYRIEQR